VAAEEVPQMNGLGIETELQDLGRVVVRLSGELDIASYLALDEALRTFQLDGRPNVTVDLSGLTFMDSTGLRVLLEAHLRTKISGGSLVIRRGPRTVQRVFEISGVIDRLTFEAGSDSGADS
jgi:anti-sigma B factor antagonist